MKPIIYATTTMIGIVCLHRAFPLQRSPSVAPFATLPIAEQDATPDGSEPQSVVSEPFAWQHDYATAVAKAKQQSKPLLVRFSAVWCGPCHRLDTLSQSQEVIQRLERFVCLKVDVDKNPEWKMQGKRIPLEAIYDPTTMRPLRPAYNPLTVGDYAAFLEKQ